jgi:hypothetical protein
VRTALRITAAGVAAAAAALFTVAPPAAYAALPAAPSVTAAGPVTNGGEIPADCTLTAPSSQTRSLTCTDRPATQRWRLYMYCFKWVNVEYAVGNIVTGNGTSTATCPPFLDPSWPGFEIVP